MDVFRPLFLIPNFRAFSHFKLAKNVGEVTRVSPGFSFNPMRASFLDHKCCILFYRFRTHMRPLKAQRNNLLPKTCTFDASLERTCITDSYEILSQQTFLFADAGDENVMSK